MVRVCFVCLGNICRSPTAEGIMLSLVERAGLSDRIQVDSAGTAGYHEGEPADARSAAVAQQRGIALPSRARQFVKEDFARFDYVLAMDSSNARNLRALAPTPALAARISLLREHQPAATSLDVPDPYYGGASGFDDVFDMCEEACTELLARIREEHSL